MSLFGALMGIGDIDDDGGFFGDSTRQMSNMMNSHLSMMNSFFSPSFGMLAGPFGGRNMLRGPETFGMGLMPFQGFPEMRMFDGNFANGHSFSQSTVMTMTSGPDGRPQVYQASSSTRQGPGGLKETRKTMADSRTGLKKMQIGHHIGNRGHIVERENNYNSGEAEERQEFINIDEDDAEEFDHEWRSKLGRSYQASLGQSGYPHERRRTSHQLALPSTSRSEQKKKRPHEHEPDQPNIRRKNLKKTSTSSEPIPVVEEPDSDEEPKKTPKYSSSSTYIEELE